MRSQIIQKCRLSKVREKGLSDTDISLPNLLKYGRTLEATLTQGQAMAGSTTLAPGQNKQRLSVQTLVFSRQSCNITVLPPNGLVRVIETSQPADTPPGDRIIITEILNRVATSVGQQKATKDATAAAVADRVIFFRGTHNVRDNFRSIFNSLF